MSETCSLVIVVVEDDHHKMLVYRYLVHCGLKRHAIRIERSPSGRGSAENWVQKRFVKEVSEYRSRHAQTALIVVIDADTGSVQDRLTQLDQALTQSGKDTIDPHREQIARLAPKRNIETWILCLNGQTVDEHTDYKNRTDWRGLITDAANALFQWTQRSQLLDHCVDSLRSGITELKRLSL